MPIHDWTRVEPGKYHAFHHMWIEELHRALNAGVLPAGYFAVPEQDTAGYVADVLTLRSRKAMAGPPATTAPATRFVATAEPVRRRRKSHVAVKRAGRDETVAVIEVVSAGNKKTRDDFRAFVVKAATLIEHGVHLLVVDPFPPTRRDPHGLHAAIWKELTRKRFAPPADKPLTLVSYEADVPVTAYIEPVAVGDRLPPMPLYLAPKAHVTVPLEETYQAAWHVYPSDWQALVIGPNPSQPEA